MPKFLGIQLYKIFNLSLMEIALINKIFKKFTIISLLCSTSYSYGVTSALLINDSKLGTAGVSYIASINNLSDPIEVTNIEYGAAMKHELIPQTIPPNYRPKLADENSPYAKEHSNLDALGLAFDNFPNGISGGFVYIPQCGSSPSDPRKSSCWLDGGAEARVHYKTMCRGKPVYFQLHMWHGIEPRGLNMKKALAALSGITLAPSAITYLVSSGYIMSQGFTYAQAQATIASRFGASGVMLSPLSLALSAAVVSGLVMYTQLAPYLSDTTVFYSQNAYSNIEADNGSSVTKPVDTILEEDAIVDNCLKITSNLIEAPYLLQDEKNHNVPNRNDAVVSMTFSPIYSATDTCTLGVDKDGIITGKCKNNAQSLLDTHLNYHTDCSIGSDVINDNGVLKCEHSNLPLGSYQQSCTGINYKDGILTAASCGGLNSKTFNLRLDYLKSCQVGSLVQFIALYARPGYLSCVKQ
jgi:hypothetical protein